MPLKSFAGLVKEAGEQWVEDKAPRLGAALAYYIIFSIAPLLVIAIGIAGLVFGHQAAQAQISQEVSAIVGAQGGQAIEAMIQNASQPRNGILGTVLGFVMLLFGASGLFGQLQDALDTVWEVQPKRGRGIVGWIHDRFLSFAMVIGIAFLLLISMLVSSLLTAFWGLFGNWEVSAIGLGIQIVFDLIVMTPMFALIFRFLPDAEVAWKDVWVGAAVTAVLFIIGQFLIGIYLGKAGVGSAYGAASSLAVLLVWLYYSTQIFLFGAELTRAYANRFGSHVVPKPHAEMVTDAIRAQQGTPRADARKPSAK